MTHVYATRTPHNAPPKPRVEGSNPSGRASSDAGHHSRPNTHTATIPPPPCRCEAWHTCGTGITRAVSDARARAALRGGVR